MNIYVLCPDSDEPHGGVKMLYRYVDALNDNGFRSWVVHSEKGFRCSWFRNDTSVRYLPGIELHPEDCWVMPEVLGPGQYAVAEGCRKVIFNQNCYYTFSNRGFLEEGVSPAYLQEQVVGAQVVSEDSRRYLEYAFPGILVGRVHYPLDHRLFAFSAEKRPRIAFMTRKNPQDAVQVLAILRSRGALEGMETVAIDGKCEEEVASMLRDSFLFLSFGYPEGFGLPAAEAMLCGCSVVGFHGMGGLEFFKARFSSPVASGEIVKFAEAAEEQIRVFRSNPETRVSRAREAADFIRDNFNRERWVSDIGSFWRKLLDPGGDSITEAARAELLARWHSGPGFPAALLQRLEEAGRSSGRLGELERLNENMAVEIEKARNHIAALEMEDEKKGRQIAKDGAHIAALEARLREALPDTREG